MAKISLAYPDSGLTISISVKTRVNGEEVFSGTMTEVAGSKVYIYDFTEQPFVDYVYIATVSGYSDVSGVIYQEQILASRGGGDGVDLGPVMRSISALQKEVARMNEEKPEKEVEPIDFTPILDKIESIEIPETKLEEKEAKKALKLIEKLDKKLTGYIDKEMNEKEELGAITREFTKLEMEEKARHDKMMNDKMEKEAEEKRKEEEEKKKEEEQDAMELELIKAEFEKQDEMEKEEKRKELEAELKEMAKEMEEKEKELKKL